MTFEGFGLDVGGVKRTRHFIGENTAGMTDVDETAKPIESDREPDAPVRLGGMHLATRKPKSEVFSG
jgi:hypothetical protein